MSNPLYLLDDPEVVVIKSKAPKDAGFAIATALLELAIATGKVAHQIEKLGLADAATPMGALELTGKTLADALESGMGGIAEAITKLGAAADETLPP